MRLLFFFACDCGVTFLYCNIPVIKTAMKQQRSNIWHWPSLQAWRREIREHRQSAYRIEVNIKQTFILPKQRSMRYRHKIWLPGGVYPFRLQVGKNLTTADSLLFASSDINKKKSSKLKHFEYVTTLDAGNDTYLFLPCADCFWRRFLTGQML